MKSAASNLNRIPGGEVVANDMHLAGADGDLQLLDYIVRDNWPAVPEMDHASNATGIADLEKVGVQVETCEQVAREEGFREPDGAPARGALEPDPGQIDLNAAFLTQVRRRDMLVLDLGS
ncbi:MAG: hypothetical protein WCL11_15350 [Verrucomicrobiota bacterium]